MRALRARTIGIGLLITALIGGCGSDDPNSHVGTSDETGQELNQSPYETAPEEVPQWHDQEPHEHQSVPEWDEHSRDTLIQTAEAAMAAFAQPGAAHDQWWQDLEPFLTQQAAALYVTVDTENLPPSEVTDSAIIVQDESAYVAQVEVPTDAGTYTLILSRRDADADWLVARFTPPEPSDE